MNRRCTNPQIGVLLHAFELRALDSTRRESFEDHLLKGESCFLQVKEFEEQADILTNDKDILDHVPVQPSDRSSMLTMLISYAWPKTPLLLKPAILVATIIFLVYPAYLGMKQDTDQVNGIKPVQVIRLTPTRTAHMTTFDLSSDRDGIISFTFPEAVVGKEYRASVIDANGHELIEGTNQFVPDIIGKAELLFPVSDMRPGKYRLIISDPASDPPVVLYEYRFQAR